MRCCAPVRSSRSIFLKYGGAFGTTRHFPSCIGKKARKYSSITHRDTQRGTVPNGKESVMYPLKISLNYQSVVIERTRSMVDIPLGFTVADTSSVTNKQFHGSRVCESHDDKRPLLYCADVPYNFLHVRTTAARHNFIQHSPVHPLDCTDDPLHKL